MLENTVARTAGFRPVTGIVVLGMHRSGTSAVTRVINLLGADLGPEEDLLTDYDNPSGHWESKTLTACNDAILAAFGRSWDFPPWLGSGWEHSPRASALLPQLRDAFSSLGVSGTWAWKDPRTCLTLPLWRRVLGDLCAVLVLRDPSAVVDSIRRRDGIPVLYGTALWHHYVRAAVAGAAGLPFASVHFEDLVAHPGPTIDRLVTDLGRLGVELGGDVAAATASLENEFVHHEHNLPVVERLTSKTVERLRYLPPTTPSFEPPSVARAGLGAAVHGVLPRAMGHPSPCRAPSAPGIPVSPRQQPLAVAWPVCVRDRRGRPPRTASSSSACIAAARRRPPGW